MVILPIDFVATKYPGYFFNISDGQLYSLKIDGVLKPLKFAKPNHFNHMIYRKKPTAGGYYVSVKGRKRLMLIENLKELTQTDAEIPVRNRR